ncbi:hypothetical protein EGT74_23475 [Chitinophaga lutea]|uniref:Uncharacterized protein n=1 Tax=Chitinophaga lutea TaxID=2488634 RepID=A0A3N4P9L6_9BACT|nr:hypothetical protein EGT74_23475 [Chitinophaga lutea]
MVMFSVLMVPKYQSFSKSRQIHKWVREGMVLTLVFPFSVLSEALGAVKRLLVVMPGEHKLHEVERGVFLA